MKPLRNRLADNDPDAFVELYEEFADRLFRFIRYQGGVHSKADCADIIQDVFLRLVRYRKHFLRIESVPAYLFSVTRNELRRRHASSLKVTHVDVQNREIVGISALDSADRIEQMEWVELVLSQLECGDQEILRMKLYSGLTFREIGEVLNLPTSTVSTRYRRSIEQLQMRFANRSKCE